MKIVVPAVMLSIAAGSVAGQNPADKERLQTVDSIVAKAATEFMANQQTIGLSIGIYKDKKTYTYNFGSTERRQPQSPDGSNSLCDRFHHENVHGYAPCPGRRR